MIKARLTSGDGKPILFFGLTKENVDARTAGRPLMVNLTDFGRPEATVIVHYGEDMQALVADLRKIDPTLPDVPEVRSGDAFRYRP